MYGDHLERMATPKTSQSICSQKSNALVYVYELCPNVLSLNRKKLPLLKEVIGLVLHYGDENKSYD